MKRYDSTQINTRFDGKRVYRSTSYPVIEPQDSDTIVITNEVDYLDSLAFTYYGDPTLWWVIALANNLGKARLSVPAGLQLRIPANVSQIVADFNNLNK
jgi:nucleoid-associated protein YgaU